MQKIKLLSFLTAAAISASCFTSLAITASAEGNIYAVPATTQLDENGKPSVDENGKMIDKFAAGKSITDVSGITLTFGAENDDDFFAGTPDSTLQEKYGFESYTGGNDKNPNVSGYTPNSGTFYKFEIGDCGGTLEVGIVLNSDKAFYVTDGTKAIPGTVTDSSENIVDNLDYVDLDGVKVTEKLTGGIVTFDVDANNTYYVYCTGSKLGFYGFEFTLYTTVEPEVPTGQKKLAMDQTINVKTWSDDTTKVLGSRLIADGYICAYDKVAFDGEYYEKNSGTYDIRLEKTGQFEDPDTRLRAKEYMISIIPETAGTLVVEFRTNKSGMNNTQTKPQAHRNLVATQNGVDKGNAKIGFSGEPPEKEGDNPKLNEKQVLVADVEANDPVYLYSTVGMLYITSIALEERASDSEDQDPGKPQTFKTVRKTFEAMSLEEAKKSKVKVTVEKGLDDQKGEGAQNLAQYLDKCEGGGVVITFILTHIPSEWDIDAETGISIVPID